MAISYEEALNERTNPENRWVDAGIPQRFFAATFDSYDVNNNEQNNAYMWALEYANSFTELRRTGTSAILCGRTGTGKTHLAVVVAKEVLARGFSVRFATVQRAVREIKDSWHRESKVSYGQVLARFTQPDLLVLDEVGIQFGTDAEKTILSDLLGERYDEMRPTIVISNLTCEGVEQFLGDRIVDRLRENGGQLVVFNWDSHRKESP